MLESLKLDYCVSSDKNEISSAKSLIFPGQGHFGQAMNNLKEKGLDKLIPQLVEDGKKFLGICIGLQILFERSEEAPETNRNTNKMDRTINSLFIGQLSFRIK